MNSIEKPRGLRDERAAAGRGLRFSPALKGLALFAAFLAYVIGFSILFAIVAATVSEGDGPTAMRVVGP
jgi:hypothetical protein